MPSTHVLYEEDGAFKAATVLTEAGGSLHVETASGKRSKVKGNHVLLRFVEPSPLELIRQAQQASEAIDLDFLWECAPQEEFAFLDLARDYHGRTPTALEAGALLLRLHGAPMYFYRKGRGCYRAAPPETLRAALAAVQRKKEQAEQVEAWAQALAQGVTPEPIAREAARLLVRPDRQTLAWKALERACQLAGQAPPALLLRSGAFADAKALHVGCFLDEFFPAGVRFSDAIEVDAPVSLAERVAALPRADVEAFSIDDSTTTEIDDGFSVTTLPDGRIQVGVHIAAPGLGVDPGDALDVIARERMSTVYMPGDKITMLPDPAIEWFSLEAGREVPTLSLYLELDDRGQRIVAQRTCLERIVMRANMRHDQLDGLVTPASLDEPAAGADDSLATLPQAGALRVLWRLALALSAERDRVRGKPEALNRVDFSFYVDMDEAGLETVRIVPRRRDAPLDRIVAELMIVANATWGAWLAAHQIPAIYRSQAVGGRVRMSSHPLPHQGLGVAQYGWATSPLRRYVDLVNQRQLIALVQGAAPPYAPKDADLFAVISAFEARYGAYSEFQKRMERYWCLRWLAQTQGLRQEARVVREDLVRLVHAPLYLPMPELPALGLAPGRQILIELGEPDFLALNVAARFLECAPQAVGDRVVFEVEIEDALSGVDEVPGPPALEAADHAVASGESELIAAHDAVVGESEAGVLPSNPGVPGHGR